MVSFRPDFEKYIVKTIFVKSIVLLEITTFELVEIKCFMLTVIMLDILKVVFSGGGGGDGGRSQFDSSFIFQEELT